MYSDIHLSIVTRCSGSKMIHDFQIIIVLLMFEAINSYFICGDYLSQHSYESVRYWNYMDFNIDKYYILLNELLRTKCSNLS